MASKDSRESSSKDSPPLQAASPAASVGASEDLYDERKELPPSPAVRHSSERRRHPPTGSGIPEDPRPLFIFEVDDEADEDLLAVLDDPLVPESMSLCTVECPPGGPQMFQPHGGDDPASSVVYGVRRIDLFEELGLDRAACVAGAGSARAVSQLTRRLAEVLNEMYSCVLFRQLVQRKWGTMPVCCLAAVSWRLAVLEDDVIELVLTGQMLASRCTAEANATDPRIRFLVPHSVAMMKQPEPDLSSSANAEAMVGSPVSGNRGALRTMDANSAPRAISWRSETEARSRQVVQEEASTEFVSCAAGAASVPSSLSLAKHAMHLRNTSFVAAFMRPIQANASVASASPSTEESATKEEQTRTRTCEASSQNCSAERDGPGSFVLVSALSSVPCCTVERYCGLVTVHMVKETADIRGQFETLQVFYHQFVAEALLIAKAQVLAVGGNALLGYRINNLFLHTGKHNKKAYAVISISGDAGKLSSPTHFRSTDVIRETL